jgi:branched-chain amino acid transport system permease protein
MAILGTTILGMVSYKLIIDRVKAHEITVMIISLALSIFFQEILMLAFSGEFQSIPPFKRGFVEIMGARVSFQKAFTIVVSLGIIGGLELLLAKTRLGMAIRAVAQDREIANVMGINVNRICLITTTLAMALAGVAGIMVAPIVPLDPHMWIPPLMVILASIVLGGMGSLRGSILAAFILAYVETLVIFLVPLGSFLKEAVLLAVMAVVLLAKPEGLFGLIFEEERL